MSYSLMTIGYEIFQKGKIICSYDLEMLDNNYVSFSCRGHSNIDLAMTEISQEDAQKAKQDKFSDMSWYARQQENDIYYRIDDDIVTVHSYSVCGNSKSIESSCALDWEIDSVGIGEILSEYIDLNELYEYCKGNGRVGYITTLWDYSGYYDAFNGEYDSECWMVGLVTDEMFGKLAEMIGDVK